MRGHPLLIDRLRWALIVTVYCWPKRQIRLWPVTIDITGRGNALVGERLGSLRAREGILGPDECGR